MLKTGRLKFIIVFILSYVILTAQITTPKSGFCDDNPGIDDSDNFFQESDKSIMNSDMEEGEIEDNFFSDDSENFDTQTQESIDDVKIKKDSSSKSWRVSGDIQTGAGYKFAHNRPDPGQTDHRGLSSLYGSIDLELEYKFSSSWRALVSAYAFYDSAYTINGRDKYPPGFLDIYEKEIKLNKAYIEGTVTDNFDIKIGRQLVVWGKSDNIRITDILNPLNSLNPGLTDLEDLRIPVFISRFDYYINSWAVSAFFIHEHQGNLLPVFGSDFFPFPFDIKEADTPYTSIDDTGFAMSISRSRFLPGMDIAFYAARIYDNNPYIEWHNADGIPSPVFKYARINVAGAAVNKAMGNFLFKTEAAFLDDLRLSNLNNKYSRLDILGGLEYSGFKNTNISFEVADRWYPDLDRAAKNIKTEEHNIQYALRTSRSFMNDILDLSILASYFGIRADRGGFLRLKAEYDLTDSIHLLWGIIFYESGSIGELKNIGDNDTVFASIKYSF
ncbi:MAG: DUF1302 family protein [Thermodesulfobacteriota bacterium]